VETRLVQHGEVTLHVDVAGEGPTVLFLHGWPDTGVLWHDVATHVRNAGYRTAVPDLRGCGRSSKPTAVSDYAMHLLVGDVAALVDELGGPVALVGHDWGSNLAWATAAFRPDLVSHLVALSVGHPTSFRSAGLVQQMKSWYTLLFSFEGIAEQWLRKNDHEALRTWLGHPDVESVIRELERENQLSTHLNWYRANIPPESFVADPPVLPPIQAPTLGVWSTNDFALSEAQMQNSVEYCTNGFTYKRIEGPGHWMPLEDPEGVARLIIEFLP
jgi:pimeloyl-ACP methyl ester carboxylesterase